jgi:hypothetical protein
VSVSAIFLLKYYNFYCQFYTNINVTISNKMLCANYDMYLFGRGKSRCMYPLILINYLTYIVKRSLELISISSGSDQDNHSNLRSIFVSLGRKNLKDAITNLRHNNSSVENLFSVFTSWANEQSYYWFKIFLELGLNLVFFFFFWIEEEAQGPPFSFP